MERRRASITGRRCRLHSAMRPSGRSADGVRGGSASGGGGGTLTASQPIGGRRGVLLCMVTCGEGGLVVWETPIKAVGGPLELPVGFRRLLEHGGRDE